MHISLPCVVVVAGLVALASNARADIYRCVGAEGNTSYSDVPCPRNAVSTSNITDSVGACTSAQCEEQRRQQASEAKQRLRAEKDELGELVSKRKQAEAEYERERGRLDELRYRQSVEDRLAAMADQAAQGANYPYYDYPGYPVYPVVGRPCGQRCNKLHPHLNPNATRRLKEPSVRLRAEP